MLRRVILCGLLALLLVARVVPAQAAKASLTIGTTESLNNLDPADADDVFTWEVLNHLYTGLVEQSPGTLTYRWALAEAQTTSDDGLTHTFTMRSGITFDDGTPITAQTFVDSINRVVGLKGRGSAFVTPYVKAVKADDARTLVFTLTAPIPYFEWLLTLPPYFPAHPNDFKPDSFQRTPSKLISNGVYQLEKFEPGQQITLKATPNWKRGKPAATPSLTIKQYSYPADLRRALTAQQVDVVWRGLPPDEIDLVLQKKGVRRTDAAGLQAFYLVISQTQKPFDDPAARRGMLHLFNRDDLTRLYLHGAALPLHQLVPPQLSGSSVNPFPDYDLKQAITQLDQAGYSKYRNVDAEIRSARLLYGDLTLAALGQITSDLRRSDVYRLSWVDMEPKSFYDQIERAQFRAVLVGWTPLVPHPDAYLRPLLHSKGVLAAGANYRNTQIDQLLDRAAAMPGSTAQTELYNQVQAVALKDVVAIPLWQSQQTVVAWDSIGGISIEPNYLLRYDQLFSR